MLAVQSVVFQVKKIKTIEMWKYFQGVSKVTRKQRIKQKNWPGILRR